MNNKNLLLIENIKKQLNNDQALIAKDRLWTVGPFKDDNVAQFINSGSKGFEVLLNETNLKPSSIVMDYGCGVGRVAMYLANYLSSGYYIGLDVMRDAIKELKARYTNYDNFEFHFLNMFNDAYNKAGWDATKALNEIEIDKKVDLIFNFSIFTHLLPNEISLVLNFFKKVLKDDGEIYLTAYLMTEKSRKFDGPNKRFYFKYPYEGAFVNVQNDPAGAIAYTEEHIENFIKEAGFKIIKKEYGFWGGGSSTSYQDSYIIKKML